MRFGMKLPGPFYVSWRIGGRRRSTTVTIFAALIEATIWVIIATAWVYWQILRGLAHLALGTYRLGTQRVLPAVQAHLAARHARNGPLT